MQFELSELTLETLGNGAASDLFDEEFHKVLRNIADPNSDAKAVREVVLKFRIKPSEDRSRADIQVVPTHKLAPLKPFSTGISLVSDGSTCKAYADRPYHQPELPGTRVLDMKGKEA